MIETVRWQPHERLVFLGRNGTGRCTGIEIFHHDGVVFLQPITSKGVPARCEIAMPITALAQVANIFSKIDPHNIQS